MGWGPQSCEILSHLNVDSTSSGGLRPQVMDHVSELFAHGLYYEGQKGKSNSCTRSQIFATEIHESDPISACTARKPPTSRQTVWKLIPRPINCQRSVCEDPSMGRNGQYGPRPQFSRHLHSSEGAVWLGSLRFPVSGGDPSAKRFKNLLEKSVTQKELGRSAWVCGLWQVCVALLDLSSFCCHVFYFEKDEEWGHACIFIQHMHQ